MDKIQLSVIMCVIAEKLAGQRGSDKPAFSILHVNDEVFARPFIWEVDHNTSNICFIDNYIHMLKLGNRIENDRNVGRQKFYYKWDKEMLYPLFNTTVTRILVDEWDRQKLLGQMNSILDEHYRGTRVTYPYHDLQWVMDTKGEALFFWLLSPSGTTLCPVDDPDAIRQLIQKLTPEVQSDRRTKMYTYSGTPLKFVYKPTALNDLKQLLNELENPEQP